LTFLAIFFGGIVENLATPLDSTGSSRMVCCTTRCATSTVNSPACKYSTMHLVINYYSSKCCPYCSSAVVTPIRLYLLYCTHADTYSQNSSRLPFALFRVICKLCCVQVNRYNTYSFFFFRIDFALESAKYSLFVGIRRS
jgi:hypothetical protein